MDSRFRPLSTALVLAAACVCLLSPAAHADDSLYRTFGEKPGLVHITDDFVANLLADPRTKTYFDGVSLKRLKQKLVEQFCVLTGGPCEYTGRSMKESHE
jgi:hemoglobin